MDKIVNVKAHTRKVPAKKINVNKHGIKQNLTKKELADRKRLAAINTKAYSDMNKYRDKDHIKYRKASDNYWDTSEKLQKKYGVH